MTPMVSVPQLRRDLFDVETQLRFARARLQCYELLGDEELARHTQRVVEGLEQTRQILSTRLQSSHVHIQG